jgi:hypothetical protein
MYSTSEERMKERERGTAEGKYKIKLERLKERQTGKR